MRVKVTIKTMQEVGRAEPGKVEYWEVNSWEEATEKAQRKSIKEKVQVFLEVVGR